MVSKDQILLVLGVHEGRRFPKRQNCLLSVEAKFDGEILSTDPVNHVESPEFSTELAWELDKKTLHQHRLQRTPVKLECFALDKITGKKESVGYCILDQRSAQHHPQKPQWHPLLSSKYQKLKPEVKVALSLEDDTRRNATPAKSVEDSQMKTQDETPKKFLVPILNDDEGYYIINGSDKDSEKEVWVISVTLSTAKNLLKLLPSGKHLKEQEGFYFYYSLVGNDVMSEPFYDLVSSSFPPERASVRIYTNANTLKEYIRKKPSIEIHLCSGEESLGASTISLIPLLADDLFKQQMPSVLEGFFIFGTPNTPPDSPDSQLDEAASVGVSIVLKREEQDKVTPAVVGDGSSPLISSGGIYYAKDDKPQMPRLDIEPVKDDPEREETRRNLAEQKLNVDRVKEKESAKSQEQKPIKKPREEHPLRKASSKVAHHYCYSIDLRTIKDLQIETTLNCYCRYVYPFFGSSSPVLTHPPVELRRNTEVLLPHSFCAFDFATIPEVLTETLKRVPLMVEVWHRDAYTKDYLLGIAEVHLSNVLDAPPHQNEEKQARKIFSEMRPIMSNDKKKIGSVHVVLGLEDLGEVSAKLGGDGVDSTQSLYSISTDTENREKPLVAVPAAQQEPRHMPEYAAALELEMWKEQQETLFLSTLKQKETEYMKTLGEEWKKRDKERELIMKRKVDEYNKLEETLRKSIADLEKREKQVSHREAEILRMKSDLTREHEQALVDVREASKRAQESCDHQISLERMKMTEIQKENQKIREQLRLTEKRLKEKEEDFLSYKEQQFNHPEVKLQAELNLLLLEKNELDRKLESVTKSKIHYKQQWGRALRELAKFKQTEQMAAKTRLKQQEKELEQMRLRYLAAEEKEMVKSEKEELREVREELERLKKQGIPTSFAPETQQAERVTRPTKPDIEDQLNDARSQRIAKLIEERDTLLNTGVYTTDDNIIVELDRQIRELIAR